MHCPCCTRVHVSMIWLTACVVGVRAGCSSVLLVALPCCFMAGEGVMVPESRAHEDLHAALREKDFAKTWKSVRTSVAKI